MTLGIVVNGYYTSEAYVNQIARFREEAEKCGVRTVIYENNVPITGEENFGFEKAIFLDKDVALAKILESKGIILLNSAEAIEDADDKGKTYARLLGAVRQQPTVIRPKKYFYKRDDAFLKGTCDILGLPLVGKMSRGSLGEQVELINSFKEIQIFDERVGLNEGIYQKYRAESRGRSYRVICIGGKAVGAMELVSESDFRSNAGQGGKGKAVSAAEEFITAAEKAAVKAGLGYCGVDLFCDLPIVIEVNSNAFFEEFERETGINVAGACIEYILSKK